MRIIAGRHRGRRLMAPPGLHTRPTSDRAREALMSILEHGQPPLAGARVIDLFAGFGAVGLEALSRGAATVILVETDRTALAAIRRNVDHLGEGSRVSVLARDATRLGRAAHQVDLAFLDPAYGQGLAAPACASLVTGGWLAPGARVVIETAAPEPLPSLAGLELEDERRYGLARFHFLRAAF